MPTPAVIRAIEARTVDPGAWASRLADRLVAAITRHARPGTRAGRAVGSLLDQPIHALVAWAIFSLLLLDATLSEVAHEHPAAVVALLAIPAGWLLRRRPVALGVVMTAAAVFLRIVYLDLPETCDQMAVSRAAMGLVAQGTNPWGFGYPESVPPGAPFPYGVLAGVASGLGVPGEVLAMGGILLLLAWSRALLTLALLGAWIAWIELGVCGINDQVPALLLLGGLLLLEKLRLSGAVLIALSVGIKPYAFAWVPPLMGYGGLVISLVLLGGVAIAWSPAVLWGPRSYLDSIELARGVHARPENTLNMPALRIIAVPIAIAALFVRSWSTAVLTGALIFVAVLFLDYWASFGYWLVVLPPVGIVLERALREFGDRLRAATSD